MYLNSTAKYLWRSAFVRNVFTLSSGTASSQAITMLVMPILTRLYSLEDFGMLAMFFAIVVPFSNIACWRYDIAIMLPEKGGTDARDLLVLSVFLAFLTGFMSLTLFIFFGDKITAMLDIVGLSKWLMLAPLVISAYGIYEAFRLWALRMKQFRSVTIAVLSESGSRSLIQISGGLIGGMGEAGLIWGRVLGQLISTAIVITSALRQNGKQLRQKFVSCLETIHSMIKNEIDFIHVVHHFRKYMKGALTEMLRVAKRYKNFPLYQGAGKLLHTVSREWFILLIGAFFGVETVALYTLGFKILNVPLVLFGGAISDVFFEKGARERETGTLGVTQVRLIQILSMITIPVLALLFFITPSAFALVFGPEWREAGIYLRLLTPLFFFRFAIGSLNSLFSIYEKQKADLIWQVVFLLATLSSVVIGGIIGSIYIALFLYSLSGSIMYLVMLYLLLKYSGASISDVVHLDPNLIKRSSVRK